MGADVDAHSSTLGRVQGILLKRGRKHCVSQRGQGHHKNTHKINWPGLMGPTKTEQTIQSGGLPESDLLSLHIRCYGCAALWSYGTTNSGNKGYLWFFQLVFGHFSSHWIALSSLNMRRCVQYYCNLIWHVCLISLGSLPLSEGR